MSSFLGHVLEIFLYSGSSDTTGSGDLILYDLSAASRIPVVHVLSIHSVAGTRCSTRSTIQESVA